MDQPALFDRTEIAPAEFISTVGPNSESVRVQISLGIIERFSEGLYSSPNKTFEELVSNSYDAGAERVWVFMPGDLTLPNSSILVIDDGFSMDIAGLQDLWRIGKSKKREQSNQHSTRNPIGKFGIGKLATYVLAEELSYIVLKDGIYRAVTMDYTKVQGEISDPHTLDLVVAELSRDEAKQALLVNLQDYGHRAKYLFDSLFPDTGVGPKHWTAAVMTNLKSSAKGIQQGRLRWVLSTAIPLNPSFKLYYNGDEIEASKAQGEEVWSFVIGESESTLPSERQIGVAERSTINGIEHPTYRLPLAGRVWGQAQLFKDSLQKGRSEQLSRSHGFFVRVRNRLINLDDPTFNVGVELHHGTFTRFHMVINADDLDGLVASPRESLQDSPELRELKAYMLAVFNRARGNIASRDEKDSLPILTKQGRISSPPPSLTQGPLKRMLRRALQGDQAVRESLGMQLDNSPIQAPLDDEEDALEEVLIEPLDDDSRLIRFDSGRKAVILNQSHPFVGNYIDNRGTKEALRLLGLADLLTQAYMLDESIDADTVNRIMNRRDSFLRDLVARHPRSAPVVARQLRDASNDENALEDAVADALSILGFSVQRIGGKGTPDGIATVRLGMRSGVSSESYALTYDAKSSGKDAKDLLKSENENRQAKGTPRIQAGTARTSILRVHRERATRQFNLEIAPAYTLLVAPGFQGDGDESSLIGEICTNDGITPITVDDLARLVELFPVMRLSPLTLRGLFDCHRPDQARAYVDTIEKATPPASPPVAEVIELLVQYSERRTPVTIDTVMTAIYERRNIDLVQDEVAAIIRGLAALAPGSMYFDGKLIALNSTPEALLGELETTLNGYPDRLADSYRRAMPSD